MRVVNKNEEVTGFLTINDLDAGETFRFKDETCILLMTNEYYVVDIETGTTYNTDEAGLEYRPVERVNCYVVVE
jgi:hypothetical protein